jgi:GntR family transcriptional regulator
MQIDIDPDSEVPLSQQLRDRIVEGIASGALNAGDPLASVRQLAVDFGINVATVSRGYELLRGEGLVRTNRRSGSVVARGPESGPPAPGFPAEWSGRLRTLLAEATAQGMSADEVSGAVGHVLDDFARLRGTAPAGTTASVGKDDHR